MDDRKLYIGNPEYGVIIGFLQGRRPDWDGRWLTDIRKWDDRQLEQDHHYIQWLFPLTTDSEAVFAPVLREFEVVELREDPIVQQEMLASLHQMLNFYGFVLDNEAGHIEIRLSERSQDRFRVWLTPENHNYRRISRILGSLKLAGLGVYAGAFLRALERLYESPEGQAAIDGFAMWYWRGRVTGGGAAGGDKL